MSIKDRRKALGWSRRELADRAGIDPRVVQLLELGQWSEEESVGRVDEVLTRAEAGEHDVHLRRVEVDEGATVFGDRGDASEV